MLPLRVRIDPTGIGKAMGLTAVKGHQCRGGKAARF